MRLPSRVLLALSLVVTFSGGATDRIPLVVLVPEGADLSAVRAARAATSPAPPLVGASRTIALDGGLSVAADQTAADAAEASTVVLLPGPASPALDALLRARRATAETILLVEPARPDLAASLTGGSALVLTGTVDAIRKLAPSSPGAARTQALAPPPAPPSTAAPHEAAVPSAAPPATATPGRAKTFDRYFSGATPTPKPR